MGELEFLYVYALRCKGMPCGTGSAFHNTIGEYIDQFHDKADVLEDLTPYLKLLNSEDDVDSIELRFKERITTSE